MKTYYLGINGETVGPYDTVQLLSMWKNGDILSDTFYFNDENQEWENIDILINTINQQLIATFTDNSENITKTSPKIEEALISESNAKKSPSFVFYLLFPFLSFPLMFFATGGMNSVVRGGWDVYLSGGITFLFFFGIQWLLCKYLINGNFSAVFCYAILGLYFFLDMLYYLTGSWNFL